MGSRIHQRLKAVLPVRVSGKTSDGESFEELTYTLDISRSGVRLVLPKPVAKDDVLTIGYKQRKSTFQVKWVTTQQNGAGTVAGLAATDPSVVLWSEIRKEERNNYRDDFHREEDRQQHAVMSASPASKPGKTQTETLAAQAINSVQPAAAKKASGAFDHAAAAPAVAEVPASPPAKPLTTAQEVAVLTQKLIVLGSELESNAVDPSILQEFRTALIKAREAAWIAEQRIELEKAKNDGTRLPLTSIVNNERLRTAAQLCSEFMEDFAKADLALDRKAISTFLAVAEQLVFELALAAS